MKLKLSFLLILLCLLPFACESGGEKDANPVGLSPTNEQSLQSETPGLVVEGTCDCPGVYGICYNYAMIRAGYNWPGAGCPSGIDGNAFFDIGVANIQEADIIDFGAHAGYIESKLGYKIVVDDFNHTSAPCAVRDNINYYPSNGYSDSNYGAPIRAWIKRPGKPTPVSPANGEIVLNPVILDWNTGVSADLYHLQISTNSQFSAIVYDDAAITSTQKTLSIFNSSTTYYWRVQSLRGPFGSSGNTAPSGWSTLRSFTIGGPCGSISTPVLNITPPSNGHPQISWNAVSQADEYEIYKSYNGTGYWKTATITQTAWVDNSEDLYAGGGNKAYVYYKIKAVNSSPVCSPSFITDFSNFKRFTISQASPF